jgi:hypothetical protein
MILMSHNILVREVGEERVGKFTYMYSNGWTSFVDIRSSKLEIFTF